MTTIPVKVEIDSDTIKQLQTRLDRLIHDDETMLQLHNLLAQMCDPYVPMQEGVLAQPQVTKDYVLYNQPYAHYQYVGDVYGPNIPITDADGNIVGWFSPPGETKHPTGAQIQYSKEKHPLASKEWDKAMLADKGEEFAERVKEILVRRARELYG